MRMIQHDFYDDIKVLIWNIEVIKSFYGFSGETN